MFFFNNRISSLGFNCQLALIVNSRSIMIKWRAMTHGKIDLLLKIAEFMRISNYNSIKSCTFAPLFGLTAG